MTPASSPAASRRPPPGSPGAAPGETPRGLLSLRVLRSALRRRAWLLCGAALTGLALSAGLFVILPPEVQASTSLLITNNPDIDPASQMQGDVALAQSAAVAGAAMREAGVHESLGKFLASYTVTAVTDRVLEIDVSAATYPAAVARAKVLATQFLRIRDKQLLIQQQIDLPALGREIALTQDQIAAIAGALAKLSTQPADPERVATLQHDRNELRGSDSAVGALGYAVVDYPVLTSSMLAQTRVLDVAAPIAPTRRHMALIMAGAGLVGGLGIGVMIVAVGAATSDRLRRRDEIARALGARITLSTGKIRSWRRPRARSGPAAASGREMRQIVAHLRGKLPDGDEAAAAFAVVPVDNAELAALAVAALAASCASQGREVVLADLSGGMLAARLLGVSQPGVRAVSAGGGRLTVAVPSPEDGVPIGPIRTTSSLGRAARPDRAVAAACASADLLITLAVLDPAAAVEQLATWATDVAVLLTVGRLSAARVRGTAELLRLAGVRVSATVLVGADKNDESAGAGRPRRGSRSPAWA